MMDLPKDFKRRAFEVFDNSEISEPLLMVYHYLGWMGKHKSGVEINSFEFSHSGISYLFNGKEVLSLPDSNSGLFFDLHKKSFIMVFERDILVQEHFRLHVVDDRLVVELGTEDE